MKGASGCVGRTLTMQLLSLRRRIEKDRRTAFGSSLPESDAHPSHGAVWKLILKLQAKSRAWGRRIELTLYARSYDVWKQGWVTRVDVLSDPVGIVGWCRRLSARINLSCARSDDVGKAEEGGVDVSPLQECWVIALARRGPANAKGSTVCVSDRVAESTW